MNFNRRNASGLGLAIVMFVSIASAHIRIVQTESTAGGRERYTMRVPNESKLDAVKVEGEFPAGLKVYAFEFKPGWKVDLRKDADGNIVGATWTGKLQPDEFVEFGMLAVNPKDKDSLTWKFVQTYADGSKEEFTGPVGSQHPAPVTKLNPAAAAAPAAR